VLRTLVHNSLPPGCADRPTRGRQCQPQEADEARETQFHVRARDEQPGGHPARRSHLLPPHVEGHRGGPALDPSPVFLYEKGYLHAKTISIDSESCSIGSANIDIRSFSINYSSTRCSTASGSPGHWSTTSSVTSPTAPSAMRPPMRSVTRRFDSGTRLRGTSLRCYETRRRDASSRRGGRAAVGEDTSTR
jgi:hypothetical protein